MLSFVFLRINLCKPQRYIPSCWCSPCRVFGLRFMSLTQGSRVNAKRKWDVFGLSIKSDKKGASVCDIFHQLLRRSKNSWFLEVFVIDWLWVCYENGVIFIRLFLVFLCRKTAILSFFIMNFELANIYSYARKVYSCGDNYICYVIKQAILPWKTLFLDSLSSPLRFFTLFFCLIISENKNEEVWFPAMTFIMCSSRHIFDNWQKNERVYK